MKHVIIPFDEFRELETYRLMYLGMIDWMIEESNSSDELKIFCAEIANRLHADIDFKAELTARGMKALRNK